MARALYTLLLFLICHLSFVSLVIRINVSVQNKRLQSTVRSLVNKCDFPIIDCLVEATLVTIRLRLEFEQSHYSGTYPAL